MDAKGRRLSPTTHERAQRLLDQGKALVVQAEPLTIRLCYEVAVPLPSPDTSPASEAGSPVLPSTGRRILLHICCAPCSTYTARRLRELAFDVTGFWYNPNVHPFSEHERRRQTLLQYAREVELPVIWEPGFEMVDFLRRVHGQETFGTRCAICYRMRLERTAQAASREGFEAFTTTLLISPYQDQAAIRGIGEEMAARYGVAFYFENFRRGWAEHFGLTRQHELYSQKYCGCVYSEWEAGDRGAATLAGRPRSHTPKG